MMIETKLLDKQIFLAPCNEQSLEFASHLEEKFAFKIEGFLDKKKKNSLTHFYEEISFSNVNYIVILSPNYAQAIFENLILLGFNENQIYFALEQTNNTFNLYKNLSQYIFATKIKYLLQKIYRFFNIDYLRILQLKNKHQGERVFIIGNGPSLQIADLEKLKNEITFAANKIYLSFEQTQWRPNYYFVVDKLVYKQNYDTIKHLSLKKFFSIDMLDLAPKIKNSHYFPLDTENGYPKPPSLHANPLKGVNKGNTVVYSMAEFAIYMGAKEIYFLGVDFDFIVNEDNSSEHLKYTTHKGEHNHFHKEYRKIGEKWNKPNLSGIENSFKKLRQYCEDHNVKVYNATRGGKLEVLKRVEFDSLF